MKITSAIMPLLITGVVFVSGCATRPESIPASYVSHERYIDNDCSRLATLMSDARSDLQKFSDLLRQQSKYGCGNCIFCFDTSKSVTG